MKSILRPLLASTHQRLLGSLFVISATVLVSALVLARPPITQKQRPGPIPSGVPPTPTCTPAPSGMVSWWPAENDAHDIVGHKNGALNNAGFAAGKVGQAFSFNGTNSEVDVANDSAWDFGSNDFTIDTWIYLNALNFRDTFVGHDEGGGATNKWIFWIEGANLEFFMYDASSGTPTSLGVPFTPSTGQWYHVAVTRSGSSFTFYVNGAQLGSPQTFAGAIPTANTPLTLGNAEGFALNGLLDEVEIFNRALSAQDIANIYNAGVSGKCRSCYAPPPNMVGWWPGDGNTKDIQNGNTGLLKNGATFATGEVGQGFSLNGSNQYVTIPDSPALRPANVTVDGWFNFSSTSGIIVLFAKPVGTGFEDSFQVFLTNSGVLSAGISDSTSSDFATSSFTPTLSTWYHIAFTYDGSTLTLYVNGEIVASAATSRTIGYDGNAFLIGADSNQEQIGYFFPGLIDEVEVFNRALTADEIQFIYDAGLLGKCKPTCVAPPSGLIHWWPADNTATDIQGNNNGTLQNGATFAAGKVDRAFNFNGNDQYVDVGKIDLSGTFTIDAWINPSTVAFNPEIISNYDGAGGYLLLVDNQGRLEAEIFNNTSRTADYATAAGVITTGVWQHVAVTYNGSAGTGAKFTFYVNGVVAPPANLYDDVGGPPGSSQVSANIGHYAQGGNGFSGLIDEVELFNRVLTPQEISDLYNAGSAGKCKNARFFVSNYNSNTIDEFDDLGNYLGRFADGHSLGAPIGLAFDASGNLFVTHSLGSTEVIERYNPLGNASHFGNVSDANGIAFDAAGNLYAAELSQNDIVKFAPDGSSSVFADSTSGLNGPAAVAVNEIGNLLFAANLSGNNVLALDFFGTLQQTYSGFGNPEGIAFDGSGNFFVANNQGDQSISKVDSAGNVTFFANGDRPVGLTFFNGFLYVANSAGNTIEKFDSTGNGTLFASGAGVAYPLYIAVREISPTATQVQFQAPSYNVNETGGFVTLTVARNGDMRSSSTVHYATANGSATQPAQYTLTTGDLNFGMNDMSMTIQVPIIDDNDPNDNNGEPATRDFTVTLSNASGAILGGPVTTTVIINYLHDTITTGVYNGGTGGNVSGGGFVDQGSTVMLTATPDDCYAFVDWVDGDGNFLSSDNPYSFTATTDTSVFAEFSLNSYTISASVSPSGAGTITGAGSYDCGSEVDLTATPNDCYTFTNWTEGNSVVSTDNPYVFTADSDRTLVANFAIKAGCAGSCNSFATATIADVSSEYSSSRAAVNVVNGSGLDSNDPPNHDTDPTNMWMSGGDGNVGSSGADPDYPAQLGHITFNLNGTFSVSSFRVWNYNENTNFAYVNRGVQTLKISTSIDGVNFTPQINPNTNTLIWTFDPAPTSPSYTGQVINFPTPLTAAYIRFDILTNYGNDPQDNVDHRFVGLSEIRFNMCPISCVPPPANMLAWWKGDGNANDSVGGHDGSLLANATFAAGEVGQGFTLDGVAAHVSVPGPVANFGTGDFTIDFWMQTSSTSGTREIMNKRVCGDAPDAFEVRIGDTILVELLRNNDGTGSNLTSTRTYNDGQFHHIAIVRSGDTLSIYGDGTLDNSITDPNVSATNINNNLPLGIGGGGCADPFNGDGTATFLGVLDEIELFNRALSPDEIAGIVRAGGLGKCECTPPPSDMVSWWPGEGDGKDVQDGNNATLNNISFGIGEVGQAFVFDGSTSDINVPASSNLDVGAGDGMTVDMWIKPDPAAITDALSPILAEWNAGSGGDGAIGTGLILNRDFGNNLSAGALEFEIIDTSGNGCALGTGPGAITAGEWQHIAATYDKASGTAVLYVNGQSVGFINCGSRTLQTSFPLDFGIRRGGSGGARYTGLMDEMEVLSRALAPSEIAAIYHAGSAGKCRPCTTPPNGMVSWWPGDNNANDIQGSNTGALQNGAGFAPAEVGQGFSLDGIDQYVEVPDSANLSITGVMTIDAWIKANDNTSEHAIVEKYDYPGLNGYFFRLLSNGTLGLGVCNGSGCSAVSGNTPVTTGTFHHVVGVYDGSNLRVYLDGVLDGTNDAGGISPTDGTNPLTIGARGGSVGNFFNGLIDEVEIFNVALSPSEIAAIYDAGSGGKCKPPVPVQRQLANISARADVGTGDNVAIAGFIIQTDPAAVTSKVRTPPAPTKHLLIRGIGPSITGVGSPTLANPVLDLFNSQGTKIDHNDNWQEEPDGTNNPTRTAAIQATGLAPTDPNEAALLETLNSDSTYTAILSGKSGGTGIGLVEVYDLEATTNTHTHNLSTRAFVSTGDNVLIGGLIVQGDETTRILLRAIGPSLAGQGISTPLPDPVLQLFDGNGNQIEVNNDWGSSPEAGDITASGLAPTDSKESAILFAPAPGVYTAIVHDKNNSSGIGLVESYWLGP